MGFTPDSKEATTHASRGMIDVLVETKHMTRDDAYMLASVAVALHIPGSSREHGLARKVPKEDLSEQVRPKGEGYK